MKRAVSLLVCFTVLIAGLVSPAYSSSDNVGVLEYPSANQQFSSPEQTWVLYKDALMKGDYELAIKCFCPDKTKQVLVFERMRESKRQRILQSMGSIKKIYQHEERAKYQLVRGINGVGITSYVHFARIENEWKIEHH
jgi:hypothetical protein